MAQQVFAQSNNKWRRVQNENTIEEYKKFIKKYPNSPPYSSLAREQLVLLEASKAYLDNTISSYDYFIKTYSSPEFEKAVHNWLKNIEFSRVLVLKDALEYDNFLQKYPESGLSLQVQILNKKKSFEKNMQTKNKNETKNLAQTIVEDLQNLIHKINAQIDSKKGYELIDHYSALGKAYELIGEVKKNIAENYEDDFKFAGDNYYLGSKTGLSLAFTLIGDATRASSGAPMPFFQSKIRLAPILAKGKTDSLYLSSITAYRNAGFERHADWMAEGFKDFDVKDIKK
jgi:hypothetical protein